MGIDSGSGSVNDDTPEVEFWGGSMDGARQRIPRGAYRHFVPIRPAPELITPREFEAAGPRLSELRVEVYEKRAFKHRDTGKIRLKMVYKGEETR